ncbi:hypothetical protein ES703_74259 [subsurface metagenome]
MGDEIGRNSPVMNTKTVIRYDPFIAFPSYQFLYYLVFLDELIHVNRKVTQEFRYGEILLRIRGRIVRYLQIAAGVSKFLL